MKTILSVYYANLWRQADIKGRIMCIIPGFLVTLKVPSGRIGSAWEWYHWIGLEKWIQPPTCLDHSLNVLKPRSFPPNRAPKMRERHHLFFGLRLVSKEFYNIPQSEPKQSNTLADFFHQRKVRQPIGRQGYIKPWSEQARGWIHFCLKQLRALKYFQIFKSEI
jgi:hypothetical protein